MSNPVQSELRPLPSTDLTANLGRSVVVKGELTGSQDLTVDGRVEGFIDLREHELTVGPNAEIRAEILAKTITVFGSVFGNVTVKGTLHLRHGGSLEGNVVCEAIAIQDRAHFCGSVETVRRGQQQSDAPAEGETSRSEAVA